MINVLLADDDLDERFLFGLALNAAPVGTSLKTVSDGVLLMDFLKRNLEHLPDVLFLDINMPRKNGRECLSEIKNTEALKHLPVIVYSTENSDIDKRFYRQNGANEFLQKGNYDEIINYINKVLGSEMRDHIC